jgi:hypothetical protein
LRTETAFARITASSPSLSGRLPICPAAAAWRAYLPIHYLRMNMSWVALIFATICISCLGSGCNTDPGGPFAGHAGPPCSPPDSGEPPDGGVPCTCPGSQVCPAPQLVYFQCLDNGTWENTHLSCVLGLHCRASADCMSGQACCGDPYTGSWGTQITSSSCAPAPCWSDTLQLCQSSAECVQPGFVCRASDIAFGGGSVMNCAPPP